MPSTTSTTSALRASGPRPVPSDRRTRLRLRELCDEVLASHRVATGNEPWSERDRAEGHALLTRLSTRRGN